MWSKKETITSKPASTQPAPKPRSNKWRVSTATSNTHMYVYLANDSLMMRDGNNHIEIRDAVEFGKVAHIERDFERKWGKLLEEANKRVGVLNQGEKFHYEEPVKNVSLCAGCDKEFEGNEDDYLCDSCRM